MGTVATGGTVEKVVLHPVDEIRERAVCCLSDTRLGGMRVAGDRSRPPESEAQGAGHTHAIR